MINILVVDDNPDKVRKIKQVLIEIPETLNHYDIAPDLVNARRSLEQKHYDLLLLDLQLPQRYGDDAEVESGIKFLEEINRSQRLIKPAHIIGLTAYDTLIEECKSKFNIQSWTLIKYDPTEKSWEKLIKNKINYLVDTKRSLALEVASHEYDLAIITALSHTELEAVLRLNAHWQTFTLANDATEYHKGIFQQEEKCVSVITAACPQMGMVAAAVLTTKIIEHFRPKYIAMVGIAAGLPGKGNFGDVLIVDLSFDGGSGKISTDSVTKKVKFEPDYHSLSLDVDLRELFKSCIRNRDFLESIQNGWPGEKPDTSLAARLGPLASGAGVIENEQFVEQIRDHSRKLMGVDMETYGVFYAALNCSRPRPKAVLSLKAISDFANPDKNDLYQKYAAYTSASYLYNFAIHKLPL